MQKTLQEKAPAESQTSPVEPTGEIEVEEQRDPREELFEKSENLFWECIKLLAQDQELSEPVRNYFQEYINHHEQGADLPEEAEGITRMQIYFIVRGEIERRLDGIDDATDEFFAEQEAVHDFQLNHYGENFQILGVEIPVAVIQEIIDSSIGEAENSYGARAAEFGMAQTGISKLIAKVIETGLTLPDAGPESDIAEAKDIMLSTVRRRGDDSVYMTAILCADIVMKKIVADPRVPGVVVEYLSSYMQGIEASFADNDEYKAKLERIGRAFDGTEPRQLPSSVEQAGRRYWFDAQRLQNAIKNEVERRLFSAAKGE